MRELNEEEQARYKGIIFNNDDAEFKKAIKQNIIKWSDEQKIVKKKILEGESLENADHSTIREAYESLMESGEIVNLNGHQIKDSWISSYKFDFLDFEFETDEKLDTMELFQQSYKAKDLEFSDIFFKNKIISKKMKHGDGVCLNCGTDPVFEFRKEGIFIKQECPYPNKAFDEFSVEINVPSGQLIFSDDFRHIIQFYSEYDIRRNASLAYADMGMLHFFLGNVNPTIYQNKNEIHIANPVYDEDSDEELDYSNQKMKEVGSVTTRLWAYSAMDLDYFKECLKRQGVHDLAKYSELTILDVEPGLYKATGRVIDHDDFGKEQLHSVITRVGPVKELSQQSKAKELTNFINNNVEEAFLLYWMSYNNSIFPTRRSALYQLFGVGGSGHRWENNRINIELSEGIEDAYREYLAGERPIEKESEYRNSFDYLAKTLRDIPDGAHIGWLKLAFESVKLAIEDGKTDSKDNIKIIKNIKRIIDLKNVSKTKEIDIIERQINAEPDNLDLMGYYINLVSRVYQEPEYIL